MRHRDRHACVWITTLVACSAASDGAVRGGDMLSSLSEADWLELCERSRAGDYGISEVDVHLVGCRIFAGAQLSSEIPAGGEQDEIAACEAAVDRCFQASGEPPQTSFTSVCNTRQARARYADCHLTVDEFEGCFALEANGLLESLRCDEQVAVLTQPVNAATVRTSVTVDDCEALQAQCPDVIGTPHPGSD